jgi:transposase
VAVKDVDVALLVQGREGQAVTVGIDAGKHELWAVSRWPDAAFERPWRVANPQDIPVLVACLQQLGQGRQLVLAMEASGTYGDALRQALADRGLAVQRVSGKASKDYAEVFDGVPSQHDGKDAAVVAELAATGKSQPWPYQEVAEWEQELRYWVDTLVAARQQLTVWQGRLEGLLARHWPEATRVLKLSSGTLLRVLARYGSAAALAAAPEAERVVARWGGRFLDAAKVEALLACARTSLGVRPGVWQQRQIQEYAQQALAARQQGQRSVARLRRLAAGQAVLQAQGTAVGLATACVLWVHTGDPRRYHAAAAYRKAMGLNLKERSSGRYRGQLKISKRGSARTRQWLYLAVLRLVQKCGVRGWYEAKKARCPRQAKRALVAVMRKLALALYHVGVRGEAFDAGRLFAGVAGAEPQPLAKR